MRIQILSTVLVVIMFSSLSLSADEMDRDTSATYEKCAALAKGKDGKMGSIVLASLRITELTAGDGPFVLPKDAPLNTEAIQCGRDSLVPRENDYKVLQAGFPFFIVAPDDRQAVMELSNGQLEYSTLNGEFSEAEIPRIQAFLNRMQSFFNAPPANPTSVK